jgi:hypothetical protein
MVKKQPANRGRKMSFALCDVSCQAKHARQNVQIRQTAQYRKESKKEHVTADVDADPFSSPAAEQLAVTKPSRSLSL